MQGSVIKSSIIIDYFAADFIYSKDDFYIFNTDLKKIYIYIFIVEQ